MKIIQNPYLPFPKEGIALPYAMISLLKTIKNK